MRELARWQERAEAARAQPLQLKESVALLRHAQPFLLLGSEDGCERADVAFEHAELLLLLRCLARLLLELVDLRTAQSAGSFALCVHFHWGRLGVPAPASRGRFSSWRLRALLAACVAAMRQGVAHAGATP